MNFVLLLDPSKYLLFSFLSIPHEIKPPRQRYCHYSDVLYTSNLPCNYIGLGGPSCDVKFFALVLELYVILQRRRKRCNWYGS